jgi:protein-S-isoprenylcysteine O-methyltransferase Ste14
MLTSGQASGKRMKEGAAASEVSTFRIALRLLAAFVVMSAVFFGSAGTVTWPQAWLYIIIQFSFSTATAVWLKKHNPQLLKERMTFLKPAAKKWDKVILVISTIVFFPYLLLPGLDAVRYQWSSVPLPLSAAAYAAVIVSLLLIFAVMRENAYLSRFVEVQKEKGHKVITTGPYRYVRHPMYVGVIILLYTIPVALGSLWTLIPATVLTLLFVIRTHLEDKTLHEELEGYKAYSTKVKYRLLPGIW